jgi:hypothetical protein
VCHSGFRGSLSNRRPRCASQEPFSVDFSAAVRRIPRTQSSAD